MNTVSHAVSDSVTMLRRDFRHSLRYPMMTISGVLMPVFMLLLFVYVFGGAISTGPGSGAYIDYVFPGILVMTVGSGSAATSVNVNADMNEGIIARFRTMAISRASVLTGQVIGSTIRTIVTLGLVIGIALLLGFRPTAGPAEWIAAIGLIALLVLALTWMAVAFGMATKTPGGANSLTLLFQFGPFISSAFVPTSSMPAGLAWFAENQPFTPIIDALRGLLLGAPMGNSAVIAAAWCVLIALVGYLWAKKLYNRDPSM